VSVALNQLAEVRQVADTAGRLRRGRAQDRYHQLAEQVGHQLGVALIDQHGSMRPAETQLTQWRTLEAEFESGQQARRDYQQWHQKFSMHAIGDTARAYREHLTALPQPKAYPEGEPDPVGAQLLAHLAEPDQHAGRQQRLADNLAALSDYQRRTTTPPPPRRAPTKHPRASSAPTVQPTRNQDRGYGR